MVFSSVPVYLDPPNWHQQLNHQQGSTSSTENPQLPPLPPGAASPYHHHHVVSGAGGGSIRPAGSMADRARMAKIAQPETALKCPRCESTNTKFCYFNNYSLSQPRHFCKTCRRYWTRGGALRNVPVGGGCRRNKKKKNSSSNSKSPASSTDHKQMGSSTSIEITGHFPQQTPHLPFMASLQGFSHQYSLASIGLSFAASGIHGQFGPVTSVAGGQAQADAGFHQIIGTNSSSSSSSSSLTTSSAILSSEGVQQFPFFEPPSGLYPFHTDGAIEASSYMVGDSQQLPSVTSSSRVSQMAPVKMEDNQGLNFSRPLSGGSENNSHYWGGSTWTQHLSGLNSSTTNHLL